MPLYYFQMTEIHYKTVLKTDLFYVFYFYFCNQTCFCLFYNYSWALTKNKKKQKYYNAVELELVRKK